MKRHKVLAYYCLAPAAASLQTSRAISYQINITALCSGAHSRSLAQNLVVLQECTRGLCWDSRRRRLLQRWSMRWKPSRGTPDYFNSGPTNARGASLGAIRRRRKWVPGVHGGGPKPYGMCGRVRDTGLLSHRHNGANVGGGRGEGAQGLPDDVDGGVPEVSPVRRWGPAVRQKVAGPIVHAWWIKCGRVGHKPYRARICPAPAYRQLRGSGRAWPYGANVGGGGRGCLILMTDSAL